MAESNGMGLTRGGYWVLTGLGVVAIVLVMAGIAIAMSNGDLRKTVNERQQFLNQSAQLNRLHSELVQGLANLSARSGDDELRAVLAKYGISFSVKERKPDAPSGVSTPGETVQGSGMGGKGE
jgi:hypothetical protein